MPTVITRFYFFLFNFALISRLSLFSFTVCRKWIFLFLSIIFVIRLRHVSVQSIVFLFKYFVKQKNDVRTHSKAKWYKVWNWTVLAHMNDWFYRLNKNHQRFINSTIKTVQFVFSSYWSSTLRSRQCDFCTLHE